MRPRLAPDNLLAVAAGGALVGAGSRPLAVAVFGGITVSKLSYLVALTRLAALRGLGVAPAALPASLAP